MTHQVNENRFWAKAEVGRPNECWFWKAKTDRDGYGIHRVKGRDFKAHRLAYELATGESPSVVMHTCDSPSCCNPNHLRGGTQRQNMKDKVRKDRQAKGSGNGRAKLTEHDVVAIKFQLRMEVASKAELARRYGVDPTVIRDIASGKTWAHTEPVLRVVRLDALPRLPLAA